MKRWLCNHRRKGSIMIYANQTVLFLFFYIRSLSKQYKLDVGNLMCYAYEYLFSVTVPDMGGQASV